MVASKVEEQYAAGNGGGDRADGSLFSTDNTSIANVIMGLTTGGGESTDVIVRRNTARRGDCGFTVVVGIISDVNTTLEEWALVMQYTESYERFIHHAVAEVVKARKLHRE